MIKTAFLKDLIMKNIKVEPILLKAKEVAAILKCPIKTIYNLTSKGSIPSIKIRGIGRRYLYSDIENWILEGGSKNES
ncbi:MAG: helix-turn-helix domain-containing protein [Flavobacteriaceae bacterium]|nr:helix-turn-helix domain-containing protein [Flavobacteriaceae bacterium]